MGGIFFTTFYQPIFNLLIWLYNVLPFADIGFAIIATTVIIKLILFPLTYRSLKSQKDLREIQPKIKQIREELKDDREKMAQELMAVYKEHNVNPLASCLPLLLQIPVFFALFRVLQAGLQDVDETILYPFIQDPGMVDMVFLGLIDLGQISIPLAVLAAISQYFQAKQTIVERPAAEVRDKEPARDEDMLASMNKTMVYFVPVITLVFGATSLPGGVMLYWLFTTIITIISYRMFLGPIKKPAEVGNLKKDAE